MKTVIYTHDMNPENVRLMPWRTILEVAGGMQNAGYEVTVFSSSENYDNKYWGYSGINIVNVPKTGTAEGREKLKNLIEEQYIDVLYWPFSWWGSKGVLDFLSNLKVKKIAYFPGARYQLLSVIRQIPLLGFSFLLPYLAQASYPTKKLVRKIKLCGIESIITMTDYNGSELIAEGWPQEAIITAFPGKSDLPGITNLSDDLQNLKYTINNEKYFLFFGPPTAVRGILTLIDAFNKLSKRNEKIHLVCLFRIDSNVDIDKQKQYISNRIKSDEIHCVWNSLTSGELASFLRDAYAIVLPFLIVPAEIPLAIIETAGFGKPVISTRNGGTGEFVDKFGLTVQPGNSKDLYKAMQSLLNNEELYQEKCKQAKEIYDQHPSWGKVADIWLDAGEAVRRLNTN